MQRRKLTINLQNKPRLVIERQSLNNKHALAQPTPISKGALDKLFPNKENERNSLTRCKSISNSFVIESFKPRDLNLNPLFNRKSQFSHTKSQKITETVNRDELVEMVVHQILRENTMHQIQSKLKKCLFIIIEEGFKKLDNFIYISDRIRRKLSNHENLLQETTKGQDISDGGKSLNKDLLPQNSQLMIKNGLVNYHLRVRRQGSKSQGAKFIEEHLKGVRAFIVNSDSSRKTQVYQEQLFNFAQEMSLSRFGASNIQLTQTKIDSEIHKLQLQLDQQKQGTSQKQRLSYDFLLHIRQAYSQNIAELLQVIHQRTEFSKAFVFKILQWKQNYEGRKKELNGLKANYCERLSKIAKILVLLNGEISQQGKNQLIALQEHIIVISRLFLLGNTLY